MVFRLPTHLESSFIPPPIGQVAPGTTAPPPSGPPSGSTSSLRSPGSPQPPQNIPPWRGKFSVSGLRASDKGSSIEIRVTGVEIEGNCSARSLSQMPLWPPTLFFSIPNPLSTPPTSSTAGPSSLAHAHAQARARSQSQSARVIRLGTLQAWLQQYQQQPIQTIAMVSFIPDRIGDANARAVNQANFRNLSRVLWDGQVVAVIPWNQPTSPGTSAGAHGAPSVGGILLYPSQNSTAMLTGVVFIDQPFPDLTINPATLLGTPRHVLYSQQPQQQHVVPSSSPYRSPTYSQMPETPISQLRTGQSPLIPTHQPPRHHQYQGHHAHSLSPSTRTDIHIPSPLTPLSAHRHEETPSYMYPQPIHTPVSSARTTYPPPLPILAPLPPMMGSLGEDDGSQHQPPSSSTPGAGPSGSRRGHSSHGQYGQ